MPLDIFVPYWGDPALMRETIDSVLAQTSDDWLLSVVDDCYPDQHVAQYVQGITDDRVRYVRNATNQGITENYVVCRDMATEELLVFLGCDDVLHPTYVETVLAAHAAHPEAAIIQPGAVVIDEHGTEITPMTDRIKWRLQPQGDERQVLAGEELAVSLLRGNWLYWPAVVFRTERIRAFDFRDGLPIVQDLALVIDMALAGDSLLFDPHVCFSYRRHTASASSASLFDGRRFAGDRRYFGIALELMRARGWKRAERVLRRRLISRAHAVSLLPTALIQREFAAVKPLLTHAFQRTHTPKETP